MTVFILGIIFWQLVITFMIIFTNDMQATCDIGMGFGWIIYCINKCIDKIWGLIKK